MRPHDPATPPTAATGAARRNDDGTALQALLAEWLPAQRWFAGKGGDAGTITMRSRETVSSGEGLEVELVLIDAQTASGPAIYQLLLGWRADPPEHVGHAIIGTVDERICYDALHDHDVTAQLLSLLAHGGSLGGLRAVVESDAEVEQGSLGLVISAEQSNTSIVYGDQVILKMFRRLEPGTNPDAEIHRALHAAGCEHIADPVGELVADVSGVPTTVGLATRLFTNSADGWAMATASVRDLMAEGDLHAHEVGGDFAAESHRLGAAVAQVHQDLARALGTGALSAAEVGEAIAGMKAHADLLAAQVPALAELLEGIHQAYDRAAASIDGEGTSALPTQRIHGDLHLGQALRTLRGWVLIDFEGEPSRPLAVRRTPRSPLQDVAGMLRSFDYAAHQPFISGGSDTQRAYRATEWSERNRSAFCDGYAETAGYDPREHGALLGAFELAKAVYEVGYEHGHRPAWERIPLAAVAKLTDPGRQQEGARPT